MAYLQVEEKKMRKYTNPSPFYNICTYSDITNDKI